jgi:hypothetical protein
MVGEQTGGDPSGASVNMGLSGRHSKAQHSGHPIPVGVGMTLQSGLITWELVQSAGRSGSSYGRKHVAWGHSSMTSEHSDGIILGVWLGLNVGEEVTMIACALGNGVGARDGVGEGSGDGNGVGLQSILS